MSKYIPYSAVQREAYMQAYRKEYGLKTGEYMKYPNAEAKDYFTVKTNKLFNTDGSKREDEAATELRERMDHYLALVALQRANDVAPGTEEKNGK